MDHGDGEGKNEERTWRCESERERDQNTCKVELKMRRTGQSLEQLMNHCCSQMYGNRI